MSNSKRRYRFGDITLDVGQHRVWRADRPITLGKLTFEFLRALVEASPSVVTQAELVEKVWGPRRIVTPETLAKRVMLLRQAIGDNAANPTYIEAVRGFGYRLLPPVQIFEERDSDAPDRAISTQHAERRFSARAAYAVAASVALLGLLAYVNAFDDVPQAAPSPSAGGDRPSHSLAVVPFASLSTNQEDEYFAAGLSEELLGRIAEIEDVTVVSSSAARALRDGGESPAELGKRLGLDQFVEGSVRRSDSRIRIDVRLVDTARGVALWSQTFERAVGDTFATQEEIASAVAKALSLRLRSRSSDLRYGGTDSFEAYEHYLRGRATWNVDPPRAVEEFERALAIDPEYRQPWGYLTYAYGWVLDLATTEEAAQHALERMQHSASRAVTALADSWEGHSALGWAHVANKEWLAANDAIETARALAAAAGAEPEMVRAYALYLYQIGRVEAALPLIEAFRETNPLEVFASANLQSTLILLNRAGDARAEYERNASLPGMRDVVAELDIPWLMKHRDEREVTAAFARVRPAVRALEPVWRSPADALRVLREALHAPGYHARPDYALLAIFAGHYDDPELAVELLRDAYLGIGYAGFYQIWHPALGAARRTDAFEQFVRDVGFVELWRHTGDWGDHCRPAGEHEIECS